VPSLQSADAIAATMVAALAHDVVVDLSDEEIITAIEVHFDPLRVRDLPTVDFAGSDCSTDGFYVEELGSRPWIFYADEGNDARIRFTLLHELGHHLLVTEQARLLDEIDRLAGPSTPPTAVEENVCHSFAGRILISDEMLRDVIGDDRLMPKHIEDLHAASRASWEASAVRAASSRREKCAVVLLRSAGEVAFCATSSRIGWSGWPRGSFVAPGGPLARAFGHNQRALVETFRHGLPYAIRMFCDTAAVDHHLALAVLSERPSDGHFEILEEQPPWWQERDELCELCGGERNEGWCDSCKGQHCGECGRCACSKPIKNPFCPGCGLQSPFRPGARVCLTCEADGLT
jgi:Zn-dependent peptidase ImmA (M78 family)